MKKIFVIFLLSCLCSFSIKAQEKTIEVIVKDTLLAEPDVWYYLMKFDKRAGQMSTVIVDTLNTDSEEQMTGNNLSEKNIADLIVVVNKYGSVLSDSVKASLSLNLPERKEYLIYIGAAFTRRSSLDSFLKDISQFDGLRGGIWTNYSSNLEAYQLQLYSKLIKSARRKALQLADLSGKKLGDITMVTELEVSDTHFILEKLDILFKYSLFSPSSEEMARMYNEFPYLVKLNGSLKVKFAIK